MYSSTSKYQAQENLLFNSVDLWDEEFKGKTVV